MGQQVPHDPGAEAAIIGAMLVLDDATGDLVEVIEPSDFYDRRCGEAFDVLADGHKHGQPMDQVRLRSTLAERGVHPTLDWWTAVMESGSAAYLAHAETVKGHKLRRDTLHILTGAASESRTAPDLLDLRDRTVDALTHLAVPQRSRAPEGTYTVEQLLADDFPLAEWVVPGMLRRGWRVVVVAGEGVGKSELSRQFAVAAAQGLHPLGFTQMPAPVRVLLIDLENPLTGVRRSLRRLRSMVPEWAEGRLMLWSRPGGIDVRSTVARRELERAIEAADPALVLVGPAYKLYQRHGDSDEDAVTDVQRVFDDLRCRYEFALMIEHHAPHGYNGSRDMRPFGTSVWLRWPELGFGLEPAEKDSLERMTLKRWRGDREENQWPLEICRGTDGMWPWVGRWADDSWQKEQLQAF